MSFPNAPRRGKERARPDHFAYLRGYKGEELYGYLAGPIIWLEMHTSDQGSKPCLTLLTGGELSCSKCKYGEPVCKGACGWYHWRDYKPYMLWLDESKRDEYDALRWLDKLKFGREKIKGAPVWAQKCFEQEKSFVSSRPQCQKPVDLTCSLLRLFDDAALSMWYSATHGKSDKPASLPEGTAVKDDGKPFSKMTQAAAKRFGAPVIATDPESIANDLSVEFLNSIQERDRKPSRNGKHPPPG